MDMCESEIQHLVALKKRRRIGHVANKACWSLAGEAVSDSSFI